MYIYIYVPGGFELLQIGYKIHHHIFFQEAMSITCLLHDVLCFSIFLIQEMYLSALIKQESNKNKLSKVKALIKGYNAKLKLKPLIEDDT